MPIPTRPITPYCSLDDPNAPKYFTKERVQKHLRRAGLLNKNGEILTQAEYDSKHTDIAIGRENRRKIDDAITETLNDMAKEHWAHVRDNMEDTKKKLMVQFQRIEEQYRRRTLPITMRRLPGGEFELVNESIEPITDHSSTAVGDSSASEFPPIQSSGRQSRAQSSHIPRPNELNDFRQQLNNIRNRLADFEQRLNRNPRSPTNDDGRQRIERSLVSLENKQNILQQQEAALNKKHDKEKQRIDELDQRLQLLTEPSVLDKQQIEHSIKASTIINDLRESIFNLEISIRNVSAERKQKPVDKSIEINDDKTSGTLADDLNNKIKQIESELAELSKRLAVIPTPITHYDIKQLIQNEIQHFKLTPQVDHEGQNLAREVNDRIKQLEIQLNQLSQSTKVYLTRESVEELIGQAILRQQPIPQRDTTHLEQHLNNLEQRLNIVTSPPNLNLIEQRLTQLENRPSNVQNHRTSSVRDQKEQYGELIQSLQEQINELKRTKLDPQSIPQIIDEIKQNTLQAIDGLLNKTDEQLRNRYDEMIRLFDKQPNHQKDNHPVPKNEAHPTNEQINALQQSINENKRAMEKIQEKVADINRRLNQRPPRTTSQLDDTPKSNEHPLTPKELQAIMPFIELLPTFDMFNENEWN